MAARAVALVLAAALPGPGWGKAVHSTLTLGGPPGVGRGRGGRQWGYLSKFGYYQGLGDYSIRLRSSGGRAIAAEAKELELTIEVHLDEQWDDTERLPECKRTGQAKRVWPAYLPSDGSWSDWVNGSLQQSVRPHVWYFALRDCMQALPAAVDLDFELHAVQESGSEFSVELYGTQTVALIKIVLGTGFFFWFCYAAFQSRQSSGHLHPVILVLGIAAMMQYVGYACHWCHLSVYQANGMGVRLLDILGELFSMLSQILLTSLSIFLAKGYTILPAEQVSLSASIPAVVVVVATHLLITGVAKTRDDASFKFHENEGVCGVVLVSLRLALYAWFCLSMQRTYSGAPLKIQPFITRFGIASSLHYLSYPLLFLIAPLVAPYLRHKFMLAGLFLMQAWSLGWYTQMFLTRGQYFQVSSLGGNILPTPQGSKKRPQLFSRERGALNKSD